MVRLLIFEKHLKEKKSKHNRTALIDTKMLGLENVKIRKNLFIDVPNAIYKKESVTKKSIH